jgi:hypothetical protein
MDREQCHVAISNRAATHVLYDTSNLDWGVFQNDVEPTADIPPKANDITAFIATGKPNLPGGTEGTVTYRFEDDQNVVLTIAWNVPATPGTPNTFSATFSDPDVAATVSGFNGSGSVEAVTITIVDGRG